TSWYYTRYSNKNKITVLIVNSAIVGYYVLYKISKKLLKDILDLKYSGDYDFPESELNKSRGATYISSLLVKPEFRKHSIPLLHQLYNDVKKIKEICAIAVSPIGKRLSKKIMDCVGNIKNSEVYYKNN
ncbi:MAG: hypothetical protein IKA36_00695, partial [Clostridia bacterium]|nr:hypothetical protein [Clostridia bacterium]